MAFISYILWPGLGRGTSDFGDGFAVFDVGEVVALEEAVETYQSVGEDRLFFVANTDFGLYVLLYLLHALEGTELLDHAL